jgi:energy-coupling factor transport system substrate-specific component
VTAFILANLIGVAALAWPLLLGTAPGLSEGQAHASDAPVIIALLVPLLVLVAIDAAQNDGSRPPFSLGAARAAPVVQRDARMIALLGVLVAVNAFLRIPKGPSGEGLMFILPILAGYYIGARFAFLLGTFSILASSVLTGGVGPWLPFQMFALGWVGAGAGLMRIATRGRFPLVALGVYAYASSIAYGFVMTLWFWPFLGQGGPTFFSAGLGVGETLVRYWRFYSLTSLPWDTGRAVLANVPLVVILAKPVGNLFGRVKERFAPQIVMIAEPTVEPA